VVREEGGDGLMWLAVPIMVLFGCNMKLSPGAVADVWVGCEVYVINGINARIDGLRCLLLSRLKTFTTHLSSAMLLLNFVQVRCLESTALFTCTCTLMEGWCPVSSMGTAHMHVHIWEALGC
jgi:hypothetical protein